MDISRAEAEVIVDCMCTADDEGQFGLAGALLAVRLLDMFGDDIVQSVDRGWFVAKVRAWAKKAGTANDRVEN